MKKMRIVCKHKPKLEWNPAILGCLKISSTRYLSYYPKRQAISFDCFRGNRLRPMDWCQKNDRQSYGTKRKISIYFSKLRRWNQKLWKFQPLTQTPILPLPNLNVRNCDKFYHPLRQLSYTSSNTLRNLQTLFASSKNSRCQL